MVLGALWQLEKISQSPDGESRVFQHKRACQEQCWIQAADENAFKHGSLLGYGRARSLSTLRMWHTHPDSKSYRWMNLCVEAGRKMVLR